MKRREPFAAVPRRVFEALEAHELGFADVGVLAYLINRCAGTGKTAAKLSTIADQIRWPHSEEHLRKTLHRLRDAGWITLEAPTPGGRSPWSFGLLSAETTPLELELPLELGSNSPSSTGNSDPANQLGSTSNSAPTVGDPKEEEEEEEEEDGVVDLVKLMDGYDLSVNQRARWLANGALVRAWFAAMPDSVENPPAWLHAHVLRGEFPSSAEPAKKGAERRELYAVLRDWITAEGRHYNQDAVTDEIEKRERKRGDTVTADDREALLHYWRTLQVAA